MVWSVVDASLMNWRLLAGQGFGSRRLKGLPKCRLGTLERLNLLGERRGGPLGLLAVSVGLLQLGAQPGELLGQVLLCLLVQLGPGYGRCATGCGSRPSG